MRKIKHSKRWLIASALVAVVISYVAVAREDAYRDWLNSNLEKNETLLCDRKIDNDYFFVAKNGSQIKTGSLIDVDRQGGIPKGFIISWQFFDQRDNYLELRDLPRDIKDNYVKRDGKLYAENVSYRHLSLKNVGQLVVSVKLKKYDNQSDMPRSLSEFEKSEDIDKSAICTIPVK
jgi:hypothetical protein